MATGGMPDVDWLYKDKYYNGVLDFLECGPEENDCGSISALLGLREDVAARARPQPVNNLGSCDIKLFQLRRARENAYMGILAYLNTVIEIKKSTDNNKLCEKRN